MGRYITSEGKEHKDQSGGTEWVEQNLRRKPLLIGRVPPKDVVAVRRDWR